MLKVSFLGTGTSSGVPMIACECEVCISADDRDKRLRTSVLIESDTTTVVVDTGPDFRYQMLRQRVKKLDAIVFTHEHKDHVAGLDDVRAFNYSMKASMNIYATEQVQTALKREFYYAFESEKYPGVPQLDLQTITLVPFMVGDLRFEPIQLLHYKMSVFGYRVGDFGYITDANQITETEKMKLNGVKVLVVNALREATHISHFSLSEALEIIKYIAPEKAYLTHISHQMPAHEQLLKLLPPNVYPAHDGLVIEIQ